MQVKSSIVKQLSAVQVETAERIQQISKVIAEAVSVVGEVTAEAQVNFFYASIFFINIKFFLTTFKAQFLTWRRWSPP